MQENTTSDLLQQLTALYSQAIEYYGFIDDPETCQDLNLRMQRILVKEHVLDALSIIEKKQRGMLPENQKRVRASAEILKNVSSSESEQSFEESEEEDEVEEQPPATIHVQ